MHLVYMSGVNMVEWILGSVRGWKWCSFPCLTRQLVDQESMSPEGDFFSLCIYWVTGKAAALVWISSLTVGSILPHQQEAWLLPMSGVMLYISWSPIRCCTVVSFCKNPTWKGLYQDQQNCHYLIESISLPIQSWINYFLNVFQLQNTNYFSK